MCTTAEYRILGREAADRLEWEKAAEYYGKAISVYPLSEVVSRLAIRDIEILTSLKKACERMMRSEP